MFNEHVYVLPKNEEARRNGQRGTSAQCMFTYTLDMRKQDGMVRGTISAQ